MFSSSSVFHPMAFSCTQRVTPPIRNLAVIVLRSPFSCYMLNCLSRSDIILKHVCHSLGSNDSVALLSSKLHRFKELIVFV